jgi:hypothetical protein
LKQRLVATFALVMAVFCLAACSALAAQSPPTASSLSPSSATAGGNGFTLTVTGSNFTSRSVVLWNGSSRATSFVSPTQLLATISSSDIATAGSARLSVMNRPPHRSYSISLTFTINAAPTPPPTPISITGSSLPGAAVGKAYSATLTASGGTPPYTWSVASGQLPTGLALSTSGNISGTPSAAGSFAFVAQVKDSATSPQTTTQSETIAVAAPPPTPLSITVSTLPGATMGKAYSATLTASGGTPPYTWSVASGQLPTGLTLSTSGTISGTPSAAGSFAFVAQVKDSATSPQTATQSETIAVAAPPPTPISITVSTLPDATVGTAYTATLTATGGTPPYTWTLASGQLPPGLALSTSGNISGTPSAAGTFIFSPQVKDSASSPQAAMQSESIAVAANSPNVSCLGTTYYVSNSGSDNNSGTSMGSPWQSVARVQSFEPNLRAGDCVLFQRGGVWYEQLSISNIHGTSSAPITFGNYGSGNLPVLDGGSTRPYGIVNGSASGQVASSYVTIDGFEVRNTTSGGIIFSYLAQPGITIKNNYVHNSGYGAFPGACAGCYQVDSGSYGYNEGIAFVGYPVGSYGTKIVNNIVKIEGGHNAIMIDQDTGSPLIQGNQVGPGCSHNCIDFKRSVGVLAEKNTVNCSVSVTVNGQVYPGCTGNAFYSEQANSTAAETATFRQNVVYGSASGYACFGLQGQANPVGPISANFYNNSCYAGSTGMHAFVIGNCVGGTLNVQNNILYGGGMNMGTNCPLTWDYNDKYGTSGGGSGPHDLSVNPLFANPNTMDFHLQSGSPVLNGGSSGILDLPFMGACDTSGTCP